MSKIMAIGDLHFGERGDSESFNEHILTFIRWSITEAKSRGVTKVIQLGDWFHQRNKIQVKTLTYGIEGARLLSEAFGKENVFVLEGNHDLFYLDRLDVSSVAALRPYVTVVDKPISILPRCFATPWIATPDVWDTVIGASDNHDYLFAHLELNGFMVNDKYKMEHGKSHRELSGYECVITGHYHSMQVQDNVLYVGTPYPITMNEANEDHGVLFLNIETDDIEFVVYDGLKVVSISFDDIEQISTLDPSSTSIRIEFPDDFDDESVIEETKQLLMSKNFEDVKIKYRGKKAQQLMESSADDIEFVENIDAAVIGFISSSANIEGIDKEILSSLYHDALSQGNTV